MKSLPVLALFLCLVSATAQRATAQRTWIVAPSGGDFTQIQPAINAAANGDRIEVRPGIYKGFTLNKRLALVGSKVRVDTGAVVVGAAGAEVAGIEFWKLEVNGVRGTLLLRECGTYAAFRTGVFTIRGSGPVHVSRSTLVSSIGAITGSTVCLHGSTYTGAGVDTTTGKGSPGLVVTDSRLVVADSKITGGAGQSGPGSCGGFPPKGPGGAGVVLSRSALHVIASAEIKGGRGGHAVGGRCQPDGPGVLGGTALVSADSRVVGGTTSSLGNVPKLALVATLNRGQTGTATVTLPGGRSVVSYFSETPGHLVLPVFRVPVLLGGTIHWFDTRSMTNGSASIPVPIPNLPLFKNLNLYFQSIGFASGGAAEVSNTTVLSIR